MVTNSQKRHSYPYGFLGVSEANAKHTSMPCIPRVIWLPDRDDEHSK